MTVRSNLERVDEGKIVESNVIVVILDVTKRLLVVLHEVINLAIFTLREGGRGEVWIS